MEAIMGWAGTIAGTVGTSPLPLWWEEANWYRKGGGIGSSAVGLPLTAMGRRLGHFLVGGGDDDVTGCWLPTTTSSGSIVDTCDGDGGVLAGVGTAGSPR